jgi:hypothetical protein
MHYSLFDYTLTIVFIISLLGLIQQPSPVYLKIFPVYFLGALAVGLRVEWLYRHRQYNTGVVNVWGIIEFCFFFFVLREIIVNIKIQRIISFVSIAFALFAFINIFFIQQNVGFNPVNFTIGCLITVLACMYYFIELFQKTEAQSLSRLPAFWIASGILFSTIVSFPEFALLAFLKVSTKVNSAMQYIDNITLVLTDLLFAIAFLCRIKIRKST